MKLYYKSDIHTIKVIRFIEKLGGKCEIYEYGEKYKLKFNVKGYTDELPLTYDKLFININSYDSPSDYYKNNVKNMFMFKRYVKIRIKQIHKRNLENQKYNNYKNKVIDKLNSITKENNEK